MRTRLRSKISLLFMTFGLLLAIPAVAFADNIIDDLEGAATTQTITAGGSFTNNYWIVANSSAGSPSGCDVGMASDNITATFSINTPAGVTASPNSLVFDECAAGTDKNAKAVTFTSDTPGTYVISVSKAGGTGSYNTNPSNFTLVVNPAPKVATSLSLIANPTSAFYSDNVTLTATLTKTSNDSAISGKSIQFKEGSTVLGSDATNADGQATLSLNDLSVGSHSITASFAGDDDYFGSTSNSVIVTIKPWTLKGFYPPVDMGIHNTMKGGQTVALKFEVFKGNTELTDTSVIKTFTQKFNCTSSGGEDAIEEYATGNTELRYDLTGGQFIFNWKSPKAPGSCYRVTMTTQDGSSISADFTLK